MAFKYNREKVVKYLATQLSVGRQQGFMTARRKKLRCEKIAFTRAVKKFQTMRGIDVDGIIGPITYAEMFPSILSDRRGFESKMDVDKSTWPRAFQERPTEREVDPAGDGSVAGVFGKPGDESKFASFKLPFPWYLSWCKTKTWMKKLYCQKVAGPIITGVMEELRDHYGTKTLQELKMDCTGGVFNNRLQMGGTRHSQHAWGAAWDTYPKGNALRTPYNDAVMSRPEYSFVRKVWRKYGITNLGVCKGYDTMHCQLAVPEDAQPTK